jgi:hypothetical protein
MKVSLIIRNMNTYTYRNSVHLYYLTSSRYFQMALLSRAHPPDQLYLTMVQTKDFSVHTQRAQHHLIYFFFFRVTP